MLDYIQTVLDSCIVLKSHTGPKPRFLHDVAAPDKPFHVVSIDMIGKLPVAAGGHKFTLIAVNHLTKWIKAASSSSASAKTTASFLFQMCSLDTAALKSFSLTMGLISRRKL